MATIRTKAFLVSMLNTMFAAGQAAGVIHPDTVELPNWQDFLESLQPTEQTLTWAAALAWNLDTAPVAKVTLTGNTTVTPSNGLAGQTYRLAIIQGGAGSFTVTLSGVTILGTPIWQTAVGNMNILLVDFVGTAYVGIVS